MRFGVFLRTAVMLACAQLALPAIGAAEEDEAARRPGDEVPQEPAEGTMEPSRNLGPGYYEAPVISTLSNSGNGWDLGKELFGEDSLWDIGGWVQMSTYTDSDGLFNRHPNGFRPQQTWMFFEKKVDGSKGFDLGFRVDWLYGTDAQDTQSFGNDFGIYDYADSFNRGISGFAIPQLYVEAAYKDLSVKAGHFYTLLGYEVVPAPANFFFSHAFTMYLSEPFTHTGAVATYTAFEKVTLYGGYTLGWDTGFDQQDGGSNFLGGFTYTPFDWLSAAYLVTAGYLGWIGEGYSHSIVINTEVVDKLNWVVLSDLTAIDQGTNNYNTGGITNYLIYQLMDEVGLGVRGEFYRNQGVSYYEFTGGLNLKPLPNLMIRPEGRYQWGPSSSPNANNPAGVPVNVGIFALDVVLTL